jgi:diguanylate cyclase (GGDEF)-like protein
VLLIDLDGFKAVNDRHGHAAGDALLVETAQRLTALVRGVDTVARVGGDEFVLILDHLISRSDLDAFKAKLALAVSQPVVLDGDVSVCVAASIGIAMFPDDAQDAEALLQVADRGMYHEKNATYRNIDIASVLI